MTLNRLIEATMTSNDKDFMNTVNLKKINISRVNPSGFTYRNKSKFPQ